MSIKCTIADMHQAALYTSISNRLKRFRNNSILGNAIEIGVKNNKIVETIKTIRSQAVDNRQSVEDIVGEKLLLDILKVQI